MIILTSSLFRTVLCLVSFIAIAISQLISTGSCPDRAVVQNFYSFKYLGIWYEYARYSNGNELGMTCVQSNYTLFTGLSSNSTKQTDSDVDTFYPVVIITSAITDILGYRYNETYTGKARLANSSNNEAKLLVNYGDGDKPYWVLSTDYDTYALVWSCESVLEAIHYEYAWVLTRDRLPSNDTVNNINNILTANNMSSVWMAQTVQDNC